MRRAKALFAAALMAALIPASIGGSTASAKTAIVTGIDSDQKSVRGSCAEAYVPIFAAARMVTFEGDFARLAISVDAPRDPQTGQVLDARITVTDSQGLSPAAQDSVVAGVKRAYLAAEGAECIGVITARPAWVLRFGEADRLAAPDDPLIVNRATAAARLRNRSGGVELLDPATGQSRLVQRPATQPDAISCFAGELWRDYGPAPPVQLIRAGDAYRLRFLVSADGRAQQVQIEPIEGATAPSPALRAALEGYVREARFYPPINEQCRPRNAMASLVVGRN
jgi:hypothetical protein